MNVNSIKSVFPLISPAVSNDGKSISKKTVAARIAYVALAAVAAVSVAITCAPASFMIAGTVVATKVVAAVGVTTLAVVALGLDLLKTHRSAKAARAAEETPETPEAPAPEAPEAQVPAASDKPEQTTAIPRKRPATRQQKRLEKKRAQSNEILSGITITMSPRVTTGGTLRNR